MQQKPYTYRWTRQQARAHSEGTETINFQITVYAFNKSDAHAQAATQLPAGFAWTAYGQVTR